MARHNVEISYLLRDISEHPHIFCRLLSGWLGHVLPAYSSNSSRRLSLTSVDTNFAHKNAPNSLDLVASDQCCDTHQRLPFFGDPLTLILRWQQPSDLVDHGHYSLRPVPEQAENVFVCLGERKHVIWFSKKRCLLMAATRAAKRIND